MSVSLKSLIDAVAETSTAESYNTVLTECANYYGIRCRFSADGKIALLTTTAKHGVWSEYITSQCNGAIISDGKIISMPPGPFNRGASLKAVFRAKTGYRVYPALDGTVITVYWLNDKWRISTSNGYDVSQFKWIGAKTYGVLCEESLQSIGQSYDTLDKGYSYTFIIRSPETHPLADGRRIMLLQRFRRADCVVETPDVVDIPGFPYITPLVGMTIRQLLDWNHDSLKLFKETGNPWYGFVIRGDFSIHGENSNIFVESKLLKSIRKFVYEYPDGLSADTRMRYALLRAHLTTRGRSLFLQLFPHFATELARIKGIIGNVTINVFTALSNEDAAADLLDGYTKYKEGDKNNVTAYVCYVMYTIVQRENINTADVNAMLIVDDLIANMNNAEYLLLLV